MKATELKSESLKKEYSVVIPAADFEKEVDAKINQIAKTTKIPGFRPGKAPKEMLKQKYALRFWAKFWMKPFATRLRKLSKATS